MASVVLGAGLDSGEGRALSAAAFAYEALKAGVDLSNDKVVKSVWSSAIKATVPILDKEEKITLKHVLERYPGQSIIVQGDTLVPILGELLLLSWTFFYVI